MTEVLESLFKRGAKGEIRQWSLELSGNRYRTVSGTVGGKLAYSGWKTCEPKNEGKKNATTPEQQAEAEVKAAYVKKLDRGYFKFIDHIDNPTPFKPMLAHKYEDLKKPLDFSLVDFPIFSQPKLDGIRCIAKFEGLFTRTGKEILGAPHVREALDDLFDEHPDLILDGELYNHDLKDDFNEIVSCVRKTKPTPEDLLVSADLVQYHIYDMEDDVDFGKRQQNLLKYITPMIDHHPCLKTVQTFFVFSQAGLDGMYQDYLQLGYEGQMVRRDGEYKNGRSHDLLKRKEFDTAEFEVVAVEEGKGNWAGYAKRVTILLEDGREQGAGIKGNRASGKKLLNDADKLVGTQVTIRFFKERTPDGFLRFPVAIDWHYGGRSD